MSKSAEVKRGAQSISNGVVANVAGADSASKPMKKRKKLFTSFGASMLVVLAAAIFLYTCFTTVVVSGQSMEPTLHSGQRLLVSDAYWLVGPLKDKDIVVIRQGGPGEYIIKRIYKLGGETVDLYNLGADAPLQELKVPADHIYVLGDNRRVSEDSRSFGPVKASDVIGKVVVWPLTKR